MSDEVSVWVRLTFKEDENNQFSIPEESLEQSILQGLGKHLFGGEKVFERVKDGEEDRKYKAKDS